MRIFFKTMISVIILCVLVLVFMPLGIGHWLDNNYAKYLQAFNKEQSQYKAKLVKFQRGWFTSKAQIQLVAMNGLKTIDINQTVYQGPLAYAPDAKGLSKLHFAKAYVVSSSHLPNTQGQVTLNLSFANHMHGEGYFPLITYSSSLQNKRVGFQVKNINFVFSGRMSVASKAKITLKGNVGQFSMHGNDAMPVNITFSHIYINSHIHNYQGVWFGSRFLAVKKVVATIKGKPVFSLNNGQIHLKVNHEKAKSSVQLQYDIQKIKAGKEVIKPITLDISVKDLDTQAFVDAAKQLMMLQNKMSSTFQQSASKESREDAQKQVWMQQSKQLRAAALKMVAGGFTFDINKLSIKTKEGEAQLTAHVTVPASKSGVFNPIFLMFKTQVSVGFSLPELWMQNFVVSMYEKTKSPTPKEMAAKYIRGLINSKMLQQQGDNVSSQIHYQQGQFKVNGVAPDMQALELKVTPPPPAAPTDVKHKS